MGEYLRPVAPSTVDADVRGAALDAYRFAARDLPLKGRPGVVWAEPAHWPGLDAQIEERGVRVNRESLGVHMVRRDGSRIYLVASRLDPAGASSTMLHEARHQWQVEQGWTRAADQDGVSYFDQATERDSRIYEREAMRRFAQAASSSQVVPEWWPGGSAFADQVARWVAAVERLAEAS